MSEVQAGDPHEPSYYEIALTNRQVLVAFVILLVCVVGAFFAGVWVGRGGAPRQAGTVAASQVAQANPNGQPLQELQFFSGKPGQSAPSAQPEAQPTAANPSTAVAPAPATAPSVSTSPNQSLAADLSAKPEVTTAAPAGSEALSPVPQPPPGSDAEPSATAAPATHAPPVTIAANGAKPKTPSPSPAASTAPVTPTPATASGAPSAGATAGSASSSAPAAGKSPELTAGEMVVQVFSSADGEQAKKTLTRVNKGGYKAYLSPLLVGKQTMYRVRIGPFTDRAQARRSPISEEEVPPRHVDHALRRDPVTEPGPSRAPEGCVLPSAAGRASINARALVVAGARRGRIRESSGASASPGRSIRGLHASPLRRCSTSWTRSWPGGSCSGTA